MDEKARILEERKEKLIARLEVRNQERKTAVNGESDSNSEEAEIDNLMKNIKIDLENKIVDSEKVEKLQKFLGYSLANRRQKAIQNLLEEVRKLKISQKPVAKFGGFSFGTKSKPASSSSSSVSAAIPAATCEIPTPSTNFVIQDLKNENRVISKSNDDNEDLSLKNIENCRLEFDFEPSVVHIRNIKNSTLLFLRCDRSILMHDCENVHLYVAAQQIRLHTSQNIHLHVATRGTVIMEDTKNCFMYAYKLQNKNGDVIEVEDNFQWKTPKDFDWLAESQSPNWSLKPENEWTTEKLSF
ncbi:unnamed protein product [Caenorhabditis angaria]|uniref:C-CAP/cofactor C-like domain-containing protein n=1 Tax=Caenorhabditis angaria TaxID=860376 RepID=A0A9P1IK92_9PELO|nr:unnamed protein product [Caenorhabditis angaria]